MAELLQGSGMVEARDLTEYKVDLIRENIARHGLSNMKAVQMDATVDDPDSHQKADVLVCDLPCSGLGVMGKKTDIRYKMTKEKGGRACKNCKDRFFLLYGIMSDRAGHLCTVPVRSTGQKMRITPHGF